MRLSVVNQWRPFFHKIEWQDHLLSTTELRQKHITALALLKRGSLGAHDDPDEPWIFCTHTFSLKGFPDNFELNGALLWYDGVVSIVSEIFSNNQMLFVATRKRLYLAFSRQGSIKEHSWWYRDIVEGDYDGRYVRLQTSSGDVLRFSLNPLGASANAKKVMIGLGILTGKYADLSDEVRLDYVEGIRGFLADIVAVA